MDRQGRMVYRLDSFIHRVQAQRDILDHVRDLGLPVKEGVILEVGLGNGRTFDHIRENFPGYRIVAFDRALGAHPASTPAEGDLVLGEINETIRQVAGIGAVFAHADIGTAFPVTWLPSGLADALTSGGIAASGLPLDHPALAPLPLPPTIRPGRYHLYRRR